MWEYNYSNELYHYGVLGMKWGKRRYQNKDGSYTSAGKQRRAGREEYKQSLKNNKQRSKERLQRGKEIYKKTNKLKNVTPYKVHGGIVTKWITKDGEKISPKELNAAYDYASKRESYKGNILKAITLTATIVSAAQMLNTPATRQAAKQGVDFISKVDLRTVRYDKASKSFVGSMR